MSLLYEWLAFYRLEPWGYEVEVAERKLDEYHRFVRTGMVISNIGNMLRGRRGRRLKVKDFIPEGVMPEKPEPAKKELMNPSVLYNQFKMAFGLMKGKGGDGDDGLVDDGETAVNP